MFKTKPGLPENPLLTVTCIRSCTESETNLKLNPFKGRQAFVENTVIFFIM
jgi:hypothetical protein